MFICLFKYYFCCFFKTSFCEAISFFLWLSIPFFLLVLSLCHFSNMLWPVQRPVCLNLSLLSIPNLFCLYEQIPKPALQHSVLLSLQAAAERSFFTKACVRGCRSPPCSLARVLVTRNSVLYYSPQWVAWTMKLPLAPALCLEPFLI